MLMTTARLVFLAVWLAVAAAVWTGGAPGLAPDQRPLVALAALAMAGWNAFGLVRGRRRRGVEVGASLREQIAARRGAGRLGPGESSDLTPPAPLSVPERGEKPTGRA